MLPITNLAFRALHIKEFIWTHYAFLPLSLVVSDAVEIKTKKTQKKHCCFLGLNLLK